MPEASRELVAISSDQATSPNVKPARDEHGRLLPGQASLNPAGRPKKTETVVYHIQNAPAKRNKRIADRILTEAEQGSIRHAEMVAAYQTGLPARATEISLTADSDLMQAISEMRDMKRQLLGQVIEGEYTVTEAQRDAND